jgi:hypothetical protein
VRSIAPSAAPGPSVATIRICFRACRNLKQHLFQIDLSVRNGADDRCAIRRGSDRHKFRRPETNPHEQRLEPRSECGDRRDDAGHAGRGENQKAFAPSKAEFADMLRERLYLAIKLAVANFPCRLAGYRSERDPIRAQLRSACGQRVEAEGGNRMPAGKRVRFVQGCIFHHVSSVTLNSGAA